MSTIGKAAGVWGVLGVVAVIGHALTRLTPLALEAWGMPWSTAQWALFVPWMVFMGYSEGYRGFQTLFAPRVVVRALALTYNPRPHWVVFAPFFVMGLIGATEKRKLISRVLVVGIVVLVVAIKGLVQPWRGIIDAGVVLGLGWGTIALIVFSIRALLGSPPDIDPDLPEA